MFLNEPHSTHRYYGELMEGKQGNKMFPFRSSPPFPYFISGKGLHVLDGLFSRGALPKRYVKYKFAMLMVFRLANEESSMPTLNSRKAMDKYCSALLAVLEDPARALRAFERCANAIDEQLKLGDYGSEAPRLRSFTTKLQEAIASGKGSKAVAIVRERGYVINFSDVKGYGFIRSDARKTDLFVHYKDVRGSGFRTLAKDELVEFVAVDSQGRLRAVDVSTGHDQSGA